MEKYSRVLVIIFFLSILNICISIYAISKISEPEKKSDPIALTTNILPTATPKPTTEMSNSESIKADLAILKAEIRALRDLLETNGLILNTPEP